jgi:hypothetical protein
MPAWIWVLIAIAVIAVIVWVIVSAMRRKRMQTRFGPEYDRAVSETGSRRRATSELTDREKRRRELTIVPLTTAARERYAEQWQTVQARFVDRPSEALREADTLVMTVMRERGYPVENFEQRSSDISVDHPHVVDNYRAAHGISMADQQEKASTEDLRQAMVHYRSLFDELLGDTPAREQHGDRRVS